MPVSTSICHALHGVLRLGVEVNREHALVRLEVDQVVIVEGEAAAGAHAPWARALHLGRVAASGGCRNLT